MKKAYLFLLFISGLALYLLSQSIIENPGKPLNPKAGRVVTLKEELRVVDSGEGYYFKNPRYIKAAPDGNIYVQDEQQQLLQFDSQGRFLRNLLKMGQGPGEMTGLMNFVVTPEHVILFGMPLKILHLDHEGRVVKEIPLPKAIMFRGFLSYWNGTYYLTKEDRPQLDGGSKWIDVPQTLVAMSDDGKTVADLVSFPSRRYISVLAGGVTSETGFANLIAVPFGDTKFLVSHTDTYLVKLVDADQKKDVRAFRREYDRVKRPAGMGGVRGGVRGTGGAGPEAPEYANDVTGLHVRGDKILVQTSTVDRKKGIRFDVFNTEGRYIDSFFLKYSDQDLDPRMLYKRITFVGDFIYFSEQTGEGTYVIRKCSLVGY
ncbi:MAG: 6-bladed beta-propeller [Candidatus Aminicenantes bacterium]|nr:6-bladed beta-propeller [Candidatus Aminicenantes bacterium]